MVDELKNKDDALYDEALELDPKDRSSGTSINTGSKVVILRAFSTVILP